MLTPEQVKKHIFRSAGKGLYRSDEVDEYFEEVQEAFKKSYDSAASLKKSNDELYQRVEALANALNQLRAERDLIQKTMILAQKAAEDTKTQAQEDSTRLLRETQIDVEKQRKTAKDEAALLTVGAQREADKLLLEAQAHAENIIAQSKAKAESVFEEARTKAQQELTRISGETQRAQQDLVRLQQEGARFRNNLLDAVAQEMEFIENLPFAEEKPQPQPKPLPKPQPELMSDYMSTEELRAAIFPSDFPAAKLEAETIQASEPESESEPEPIPEPEPINDALKELEELEEPKQERIHLV